MLKIAIDAGHYINTAGKRCLKKLDKNETREWTLNSRIAGKLQYYLQNYDCEFIRVDDATGKKDIEVADRVVKANNWDADVYISIHHDAGVEGGKGGGTTVFYYNSKSTERKKQAQSLYNEVVKLTGLRGNRSEKVKQHAYDVLKFTKMPAFLIENGFMDSSTDVPIILTTEHADKTAQGIVKFLVESFGLKKKETKKTETVKNDTKLYKVQCGAFSDKAKAEALKNRLNAAGYEAVVVSGSK